MEIKLKNDITTVVPDHVGTALVAAGQATVVGDESQEESQAQADVSPADTKPAGKK